MRCSPCSLQAVSECFQCRTETCGQSDLPCWLGGWLAGWWLLSLSPLLSCRLYNLPPPVRLLTVRNHCGTNGNQATGRKKTTGWLLSLGCRLVAVPGGNPSYYNLTSHMWSCPGLGWAGPPAPDNTIISQSGKSADQELL